MTKLFQNFDQFKDVTLSISKHLKNTKVGVLREAVAKSQGYANVPAYKANLESSTTTNEYGEGVDRNIECFRQGNFVMFQGRIDSFIIPPLDDELCTIEEIGNVLLTPEEWADLTEDERESWEERTSHALTGTPLLQGLRPVIIDGRTYAKGCMNIKEATERFNVGHVEGAIENFFEYQPSMSPTFAFIEATANVASDRMQTVPGYLDAIIKVAQSEDNRAAARNGKREEFALPWREQPDAVTQPEIQKVIASMGLNQEGGDWKSILRELMPSHLQFRYQQSMMEEMYAFDVWDTWEEAETRALIHCFELMVHRTQSRMMFDFMVHAHLRAGVEVTPDKFLSVMRAVSVESVVADQVLGQSTR